MNELLRDIEALLEQVRAGSFYEDYDRSTELLGRATRALAALSKVYFCATVLDGVVGEPKSDRMSNAADYGNSPREIRKRAMKIIPSRPA